jgi:LPXTG-site transpeptidase (sortase) family protein
MAATAIGITLAMLFTVGYVSVSPSYAATTAHDLADQLAFDRISAGSNLTEWEFDNCPNACRPERYDARGEPPGQLTAVPLRVRREPSAGAPILPIDAEVAGETESSLGLVRWTSASVKASRPERQPAPKRLKIPSINVDATVAAVGPDNAGNMTIPDEFNTAGWYKHGTAPGEPGSAVIAGHFDDHRGRSVFYYLARVNAGDDVLIEREDGSIARFRIEEVARYDADDLPSEKLFSRNGDPMLALVTCTGRFDRAAGRYTETLVVYAVPVD